MASSDKYFGYLTEEPCTGEDPFRKMLVDADGRFDKWVIRKVTTWPGGGYQERQYLSVRAFDGSLWYGTSPGVGTFCRLKRRKVK